MLSPENEAFLRWWSQHGEKEKTSLRPFLVGLSIGFSIGVGVILLMESGWYTRANMEANSRLSSVVFVLAIMILSVFMAFVYRKFRWEMQEQRYQELLILKNKAEKEAQMQP
jgi:membrane protein YdbS with pleckstrin-like domain